MADTLEKGYRVVTNLDGKIIRCGDNFNTAMSPDDFDDNGCGLLGEYLTPLPKRGKVAKTLKRYMYTTNEEGEAILNEEGRNFGVGPPSRTLWKLSILPRLINLLEIETGVQHSIDPWAMGVISGHLVKWVTKDEYELAYN